MLLKIEHIREFSAVVNCIGFKFCEVYAFVIEKVEIFANCMLL